MNKTNQGDEIYSALDYATFDRDWDSMPESVRNLDPSGLKWIAEELSVEGIGRVSEVHQ